MSNLIKTQLKPGLYVEIEEVTTQKTIYGFIQRVIPGKKTDSTQVQLQTGEIGEVLDILSLDKIKQLNFKYYNTFFYQTLYCIKHRKTQEFILMDQTSPQGAPQKIAYLTAQPQATPIKLQSDWYWKAYSKNKSISSYYEKLNPTYIILENERQLTFAQFKELEHYFKTMIP